MNLSTGLPPFICPGRLIVQRHDDVHRDWSWHDGSQSIFTGSGTVVLVLDVKSVGTRSPAAAVRITALVGGTVLISWAGAESWTRLWEAA